jgi:hypothetical protein
MSMPTRAAAWAMVAALTSAAPWSLLAAPLSSSVTQIAADPANPVASVPAVVYRSPFAHVRPLGTPDVADWRQSNDLVLQRGGWRQYARQAQSAAPLDGQVPAAQPTPTSVPSPHAGHGDK